MKRRGKPDEIARASNGSRDGRVPPLLSLPIDCALHRSHLTRHRISPAITRPTVRQQPTHDRRGADGGGRIGRRREGLSSSASSIEQRGSTTRPVRRAPAAPAPPRPAGTAAVQRRVPPPCRRSRGTAAPGCPALVLVLPTAVVSGGELLLFLLLLHHTGAGGVTGA